MYNSVKIFSKINVSVLKGKSYEEVVEIFQTTKDKRLKDKCFAYIFCDLFPMLLTIFQKYTFIEPAEKVEHCISTLLHSMTKFSPTGKNNKKIKFTSYAYGNIRNALLTATSLYTHNNKKKIWSNLISGNEENVTYTMNKVGENDKYMDNFDLVESIKNANLTDLEKQLCIAYLKGYTKADDLISVVEQFHDNSSEQAMKKELTKVRNSLRAKVRSGQDGFFSLKYIPSKRTKVRKRSIIE